MTLSMLSPADHEEAAGRHAERLRSVGRARAGIEVAICDDDGGRLPAGEIGEICVKGTIVMQGYWDDPAATSDAFRVGWYHTGDLGRYDEDGFLYLLDRAKEMIISGGANIYREVRPSSSSTRPSPMQGLWHPRPVLGRVRRRGGRASRGASRLSRRASRLVQGQSGVIQEAALLRLCR